MADDKDKIKTAEDLLKSIKERIDLEGDMDDLLKSANRELKKMDDAYRRIDARLNSFYQGSINTKKVQTELYKSSQQRYIAEKRLEELGKSISNESKMLIESKKSLLAKEEKIKNELEGQISKSHKNKLEKKLATLEIIKQQKEQQILGNTELQSIEYAKAQLKLADQNNDAVKQKLDAERMVSRQMGLSGNLVSGLANKLGLGEEVYGKMVDHSRNLVEKNKKVTLGLGVALTGIKAIGQGMANSLKSMSAMSIAAFGLGKIMGGVGLAIKGAAKAGNLLGSAMSNVGGTIKGLSPVSSSFFSGLLSPINGMIEKIPLVGGLLSGVVGFFTSILDLVVGLDDHITKAGRQIGLSATQAVKLNSQFQEAAKNSSKIYVNSKALLDSQVELTQASGLNNIASQKNLESNIELSKYAGIELETRGKIYETAIITGTSMKSVAASVLGQVDSLKKATGISFNYQAILKEAASQSGRLGLMFAKYPSHLTKSLVSVKALGLELKQLETIGDTMLDFETSLSKEFEAQLLLGKDINLNKAREAFLNNDLVGAASEIAKYTGDANGFLKLNRIQQQSLADLMGMSVDSMADFLKKQDLYVKTGTKNREELMKQIELSKTNTAEKSRLVKLMGEESYQNMINLSTQEKLMASFEKIKQALVDFLTKNNVLEKIQGYVNKFTDPKNIEGIVEKLRGLMSKIFNFVVGVTNVILKGIDYVVSMFIWDDAKQRSWNSQMKQVRDIFSDVTGTISSSLSQPYASSSVTPVEKAITPTPASTSTEPKKTETPVSTSVEPPQQQKAQRGKVETRIKDAVIFPSSNMVINKDPLDYTIFTKNPSNLSAPSMDNSTIKQIVSEAVSAVVKDRPIVVQTHANLNLDGQVAARSNYTNMKNNPLIGYDKTFGQMSLNT